MDRIRVAYENIKFFVSVVVRCAEKAGGAFDSPQLPVPQGQRRFLTEC